MSKTIATAIIIATLSGEYERIAREWRANDGGLTWAAGSALGCISSWINDMQKFDRVSRRYVNKMTECLRRNYVYLHF